MEIIIDGGPYGSGGIQQPKYVLYDTNCGAQISFGQSTNQRTRTAISVQGQDGFSKTLRILSATGNAGDFDIILNLT